MKKSTEPIIRSCGVWIGTWCFSVIVSCQTNCSTHTHAHTQICNPERIAITIITREEKQITNIEPWAKISVYFNKWSNKKTHRWTQSKRNQSNAARQGQFEKNVWRIVLNNNQKVHNALHPKKKSICSCVKTHKLALSCSYLLPHSSQFPPRVSTGALTPGWQHLEKKTEEDREQRQPTHCHQNKGNVMNEWKKMVIWCLLTLLVELPLSLLRSLRRDLFSDVVRLSQLLK